MCHRVFVNSTHEHREMSPRKVFVNDPYIFMNLTKLFVNTGNKLKTFVNTGKLFHEHWGKFICERLIYISK